MISLLNELLFHSYKSWWCIVYSSEFFGAFRTAIQGQLLLLPYVPTSSIVISLCHHHTTPVFRSLAITQILYKCCHFWPPHTIADLPNFISVDWYVLFGKLGLVDGRSFMGPRIAQNSNNFCESLARKETTEGSSA